MMITVNYRTVKNHSSYIECKNCKSCDIISDIYIVCRYCYPLQKLVHICMSVQIICKPVSVSILCDVGYRWRGTTGEPTGGFISGPVLKQRVFHCRVHFGVNFCDTQSSLWHWEGGVPTSWCPCGDDCYLQDTVHLQQAFQLNLAFNVMLELKLNINFCKQG